MHIHWMALFKEFCQLLPQSNSFELGVVANDIFTQEDADFLTVMRLCPPLMFEQWKLEGVLMRPSGKMLVPI